MVIYGGATGAGGLAPDELFLLDLKDGESQSEWVTVPVNGKTPGRRYGHTLVNCRPYLVLFGGNYNNDPANDCWLFNMTDNSLQWTRLSSKGPSPGARVYHASNVCSINNQSMTVIFGGRNASGKILNDLWALKVAETTKNFEWVKLVGNKEPIDRQQSSIAVCGQFIMNIGGRCTQTGDDLPIEVFDILSMEWFEIGYFKRFRHASFYNKGTVFIHGGLEDENNNCPTNILQEIELLPLFPKSNVLALNKILDKEQSKTKSSNTPVDQQKTVALNKPKEQGLFFSNDVVIASSDLNSEFAERVKIISIKKIQEDKVKFNDLIKMYSKPSGKEIHDKIIDVLLRPRDWISKEIDVNAKFPLPVELVFELIYNAKALIENEPIVVRIEAPVKIFGDIHGQYQDLMRFFDLYSAPIEGPGGDIEGLDYLFLGDYVDRGFHSIETMCLLMALKLKYPNQIHLLRGNHEDRWINSAFGFQEECMNRLNDDPENPRIFNSFNDFFDRLPLAAVVNDTVLCLHGGIGSTINTIEDIEKVKTPLEVVHQVSSMEQQIVVDILWSDPTDNDTEMGIVPNTTRDPTGVGNIVKFGPDRVEEFLEMNNLSLIIRAHECVMDGFERFAAGKLITIFSATDYCGKHNNTGAIIYLNNELEIKPYLISPVDTPNKFWDNSEEAMKLRPPTPPRKRQGGSTHKKDSSFG